MTVRTTTISVRVTETYRRLFEMSQSKAKVIAENEDVRKPLPEVLRRLSASHCLWYTEGGGE